MDCILTPLSHDHRVPQERETCCELGDHGRTSEEERVRQKETEEDMTTELKKFNYHWHQRHPSKSIRSRWFFKGAHVRLHGQITRSNNHETHQISHYTRARCLIAVITIIAHGNLSFINQGN